MSKKYGWYSQGMINNHGGILYKTPSGETVEISFFTSSPTEHDSGWTDVKCIGEVTEYIGQAEAHTLEAVCSREYTDAMYNDFINDCEYPEDDDHY